MKLYWTPEAIADRDNIYDYIEAENPAAALALDELFSEKTERLTDHVKLGRPGRVEGTRELVAHQNYILIYDLTGDTVRILRILHAARQWPPSKKAAGLMRGQQSQARLNTQRQNNGQHTCNRAPNLPHDRIRDPLLPERFQHAACAHWRIETCLHWALRDHERRPTTKS